MIKSPLDKKNLEKFETPTFTSKSESKITKREDVPSIDFRNLSALQNLRAQNE